MKTLIMTTPYGPALCFETPTGEPPWVLSMLTPSGASPGGQWDTPEVLEKVEEFLAS